MKFSQINWTHAILLSSTPLLALYGCLTVPLQQPTLIASIVYYFITGFGITGGYHRYWSHRTYSATRPFQVFLMLAGTGAVEGSILWWCRDHRAHHRYTDTPKDPYSANGGLFWAHMGWMLLKKDKASAGTVDISDLQRDNLVMWQYRNYAWLSMFLAFVFPALVCGYMWGDFIGGLFFMGITRLVFLHHATFCVNSLAHYLGEHTYDDRLSPRDHFITALVTLGEGYHNFHHEFPSDYRNGIRYYHYDPTKWFIRLASFVGWTYDLKKFSDNEIIKGKVQMTEKSLLKMKKSLNWGPAIDSLPAFTRKEVEHQIQNNEKKWIIMDDIVYDVADFLDQHPGGKRYLMNAISSSLKSDDSVSKSFNGGVYYHSNAARNLASAMRIGKLQ